MTVIIEKFDTKENGVEMSSLRYCTVYHFYNFFLKIELDSDKTKIRYKRQETKKN